MAESFQDGLKDRLYDDIYGDPNYPRTMAPCPEIVIEQVSPELHAKLLAEATAAGAKFDGDQAEWHGCQLAWNWDADSQTLRATCVRKPFYISCGAIEEGIKNEVEKARSGI